MEDGTDDAERRLWKEHQDIMEKYRKGKHERVRRPRPQCNKEAAEKIMSKDRNNIFLKKIIEKGTTLEYD